MKRLHETDINSVEHFENVWRREAPHPYDAVRLRAFIKGYVKDGDRILDLGAGIWSFGQYLDEHRQGMGMPSVEIHALDWSTYARDQVAAKHRMKYIVGDALATPYPDCQFDMVGAGELLEHLEKPEELAREMARVCKPGGWVIISTLNPECEDAKRHGDYPEHLHEFTPEDLVAFFAPYGTATYGLVGNYHMTWCHKL